MNMEWDKITKDYPKAFSLWANYTHYNRTQNKGRLI